MRRVIGQTLVIGIVLASFASAARGVNHRRDIVIKTIDGEARARWETALDLTYQPGDFLTSENTTGFTCIVRYRKVTSETVSGPRKPGDVINGQEFTIGDDVTTGWPLPASGGCLYVCVIGKGADDAGEKVEHCFYAYRPDTPCIIQAPTPVASGWGIIVLLLSLVTALSLVAKRHQKAH